MSSKGKNTVSGFTLIELLLVIAILALLSSIILATVNQSRAKARDSVRIQDLKQFQLALGLYYQNNGMYPCGDAFSGGYHIDNSRSCPFLEGNNGIGNDPLVQCVPVHSPNASCTNPQHGIFGGSYGEKLYPDYNRKDPSSGGNYIYKATSDRLTYIILSLLEVNPQIMQNDGGLCSKRYEVGPGVGNAAITDTSNSAYGGFTCN